MVVIPDRGDLMKRWRVEVEGNAPCRLKIGDTLTLEFMPPHAGKVTLRTPFFIGYWGWFDADGKRVPPTHPLSCAIFAEYAEDLLDAV